MFDFNLLVMVNVFSRMYIYVFIVFRATRISRLVTQKLVGGSSFFNVTIFWLSRSSRTVN